MKTTVEPKGYTTVRFPQGPHYKLKLEAARRHMSMEAALLEAFDAWHSGQPRAKIVLPTGKALPAVVLLQRILARADDPKIAAVMTFLHLIDGL